MYAACTRSTVSPAMRYFLCSTPWRSRAKGGIRFIGATDETAAAFMASYHAKLTGELGVCVASSGPGAGNLVNGLADAYFDGAPVLALTGQVRPANWARARSRKSTSKSFSPR